jgi:sulfotransferase famil protein
MLISLSRKFIFVANLKSASSTIETALADWAEVRLTQTRFGKHDGLTQISQKFVWLKRYVPYEEFFVFGVIREPVDFVLSLYNSHNKNAFDGKKHSTKGMSFDEFLDVWCARSWQARPQAQRFKDEHGRLKMSHLIALDRLGEEFPLLCARLKIEAPPLGRVNPSPSVLAARDLTGAQLARVRERYAEDYAALSDRPQAF